MSITIYNKCATGEPEKLTEFKSYRIDVEKRGLEA